MTCIADKIRSPLAGGVGRAHGSQRTRFRDSSRSSTCVEMTCCSRRASNVRSVDPGRDSGARRLALARPCLPDGGAGRREPARTSTLVRLANRRGRAEHGRLSWPAWGRAITNEPSVRSALESGSRSRTLPERLYMQCLIYVLTTVDHLERPVSVTLTNPWARQRDCPLIDPVPLRSRRFLHATALDSQS